MAQNSSGYFQDLYEVGADRSLSLEEKIERAITIGRDRLDLAYGVLSYTAAGEYEVVDSTIESGEYAAGTVYELEETWCRHVVENREILVVSDADASRYAEDIARKSTGLQCYIGAPILVDGETYGTLCYSDETPRNRDFDENEQQFVQLLTQWIGYEIEREKHYQTVESQNERLDEFAGVLAHDIRNPLTAAIGYTEYAMETAPDRIETHLETVLQSLDRIETLITNTLSLAREGADVGERKPVKLETVAQEAWDMVSPANATLSVVDTYTLMADESRLRQLFENLFRNVAEHCGDDVTVTVRGTDTGFEVINDGPEMPESVTESLFGGSFGADRIGLGLLIVERVVSGHGWGGTIESTPEETRFIFSGVGEATNTAKVV
ncbi:GAF domain-containing sensor histidine kinase [Haloarcula laminariae]|uniref:GAF domain-containing sensor histidine kinase n=1 Tax=Haloarcula laminariae TaxID=2961577 RepID=UPI002404A992|nr:GAF domain-containing sensor histidine kinase [Halomicroarcula sp. FL173]